MFVCLCVCMFVCLFDRDVQKVRMLINTSQVQQCVKKKKVLFSRLALIHHPKSTSHQGWPYCVCCYCWCHLFLKLRYLILFVRNLFYLSICTSKKNNSCRQVTCAVCNNTRHKRFVQSARVIESTHTSVHMSVCLSVCSSLCLSVCLIVYFLVVFKSS